MCNFTNLPFHPTTEEIVTILMNKTQNKNPLFFRILTSYFMSKIASMMRVNVDVPGTGSIPVNMYAINLATSGSGKGHSINVLETQVIHKFKHKFVNKTLPAVAEKHLSKQALRRSNRRNTNPDDELAKINAEYESLGPILFSFDSATTAAVKQMRTQLLLSNAGSINLEIDEIGSNILSQSEVLTSFLELYDMGRIKQKLTKNTKENVRYDEIDGSTPANILLFGTPTKLLNGTKIEDEFYEMLETGYARRCFFGYSRNGISHQTRTAEELFDIFNDVKSNETLIDIAERFSMLADQVNFNTTLQMSKDTTLFWLEYQLFCSKRADKLSEYEEIRKAELTHRYFKVIKQAATYAFIDQTPMVEKKHIEYAIALAEHSGEAFDRILTRDRPYAKLASYIAHINREVTQADLVEDLPFYKGTERDKKEMMNLAISHGYRNNMVIKKETVDGIDFFTGSAIEESDIDRLLLSYSTDITKNFKNEIVEFDQLSKLCLLPNYHFVACHLDDGYRDEMHVIPKFNIAIIDVDGGISIDTAQLLLKDYTYYMYTTKRHTTNKHRFRILLPLSHVIEFKGREYKEFMNNIYNWLPFDMDRQTNQLSRKWMTWKGKHHVNKGELLDALQFIPKTRKADEQKQFLNRTGSLTSLERWFVNNIESAGGRNNMLIRYAYCLVDMNFDIDTIKDKVISLNNKLEEPLSETEVLSTIIVSAGKKIHEKDIKQNKSKQE